MSLRLRMGLGFLAVLAVLSFFLPSPWGLRKTDRDPLYASVKDDPCCQDGVYYIYNAKDYLRFTGYLNRARKEEPDNEEILGLDVCLMADLNMEEEERYRLNGHPYIRQAVLYYNGIFEGNGHRITWVSEAGNGMFVRLGRQGQVRNLTFCAPSLVWDMDEYGVGMLCMINEGRIENCVTEGRIEGTECYVGGIAGINRGFIENCVNRAEVRAEGLGDYGAGGIAGLSKCKVLEGESREDPIVPVIRSCINQGEILGAWEAGGICASNDCADIYDCGNEGSVKVRYQRGYIYPEEPDWYEQASAGGICGYMGSNTLQDCYNMGEISIIEEGVEDTYGIAGHTLFWIHDVSGCVSLKGTARGSMRHESVMELDMEELKVWMEDHEGISYVADNWEFDLKEAREKLPLIPLDLEESPLTAGREDVLLCEEFCLRAEPGYDIRRVSPYGVCIEQKEHAASEDGGRLQVWLLRVPDGLTDIEAYLDARGNFVKDTAHEVWLGIEGAHWLHPGPSYKDDCHVRTLVSGGGRQTQTWILHYRDDILAHMAVGTEQGMVDNVTALPLRREDNGWQACWLMVFTNQGNNYRPSLFEVEEFLKGFTWLPCQAEVEKGDCLYGIARMYCGDGNRYPELAAYNEIDEMDPLLPGQILQIPQEWVMEMGAWE